MVRVLAVKDGVAALGFRPGNPTELPVFKILVYNAGEWDHFRVFDADNRHGAFQCYNDLCNGVPRDICMEKDYG